MRFPHRFVVPAVLLCLVPSLAQPGEVMVNVGAVGLTFTPSSTTVNVGDHVIWIWGTSGHTCTSGSIPGTPGFVGPAGHQIQWATITETAGATFSVKFQDAGAYQYFCAPHSPSMAGVVNVSSTHVPIADFRITEVRYGAGASNFVEITNVGDATGNVQGFRLDVNGSIVTFASIDVPAGGRIVNQGSFSAALGSTGYVALFVANSVGPSFDATQIIDYVQWGAGGQAREQAAADAQPTPYWTIGDFLPSMAPGHAIAFCGNQGQYGLGFWSEVANPTPNAVNDCASPAARSTWGRLKSLYR